MCRCYLTEFNGRGLLHARYRQDRLAPKVATLDRIGIGMATSIHGTTVLLDADPTVARQARIPKPYRSATGGGGGDGDGDGDGGGSGGA